ncbi:MAG: energy transducer TonB [Bryobacterales bacterium]|nr:energy transducer TonB [Bryobacterales bacterium]
MTLSTKVGRRVEHMLSTNHFSLATLRRGVAPLIALCAIPVLYSAAAPTPAPRVDAVAEAKRPDRFELTTNLSDDEVRQLESRLGQNPADFAARKSLLNYYLVKRNDEKIAEHFWGLAENNPEDPYTFLLCAGYERPSAEDKRRLLDLWRKHADMNPTNPVVLANAGRFMWLRRRFSDAEDFLRRARELAPGEPAYTSYFALLYAQALYTGKPPDVSEGEWTMITEKVKAELDVTPDAALVGEVGELLIGWGVPFNGLAEKYLKRAETLDSGNERWKRSLARLKAAPGEAKPAARPQPERVRVGGNVQRSKLVRKVPPQYPPLARREGIQGTVRFNATIGKDGAVAKLEVVAGHPLLVPAAMQAVRQWIYQPTLVNKIPVEVITQIDVDVTPDDVPGDVGKRRTYRVGEDGVSPPSVARKVEPQFPKGLRHQGLTATVVLRVVVGSDGRVGSASIQQIDGRREFGGAAIEAVRRWKFTPGMKDGRPVDAEASIEVNFREF